MTIPYFCQETGPDPSTIEVDAAPKCPRCETELEQSPRFWGGYIWRCVACGFRKKNRASFYLEAERAERIAKRQVERRRHDYC